MTQSTVNKYNWQRVYSTPNLTSPRDIFMDGGDNYDDIKQGGEGDCYFLSACASVAEIPARFEQAILTDTINAGGIFAANIYVRGVPFTYYVDDYTPFSSWTKTAFAYQSPDGSLWPIMMERLWAKMAGSYEASNGGSPLELYDLIASVPGSSYTCVGDPVL
jgi:hypothetical protein